MSDSNQQWKASPTDLKLSEDEIHIWQASLNIPTVMLSSYHQLLSQEELVKVAQFHFEKDSRHYIAAHGVLRILLGRYLHTDPSQIQFDHNAYGKPSLRLPFSESQLHFNISHSHEVALYAFVYGRQVGIDVEYMRPNIEYEPVANYSFSSREQAVFNALPTAQKQQAFFNCWTRKEAYIKAKGKGLSLPLDQFDVSLSPDEPAALLESREYAQDMKHWSLYDLAPCYNYSAALAIEGSGWRVRCWKYSV